ncbi:S8 family serine peptidase [candidate division KSB1 bacterium]|nr:S8 family serine peptidase [candidate division KSB1 bacterium]
MNKRFFIYILTTTLFSTGLLAQKPKITKLEELPTFTYEIPVKPSEFVLQEKDFKTFADKVAVDFQQVLENYDISDNTTLKDIYGVLLSKALIDGDADKIVKLINTRRELEEKPADKLLSGMTTRILAESWKEKDSLDPAQVRDIFRSKLTETVNGLPWDVVQDQIEQTKGSLEILSQNVFIGLLQSQLDPAFEKSGNISGDAAKFMLRVRAALSRTLDFRSDIVEVYDAYIQANRIEKPDIWTDRSVFFEGNEGYNPVLIGIWDSGIDAGVYGEQMWTNKNEKTDGKDTDGNGFIDDVHGIAFDLKENYTSELLFPLSKEQADKLPGMKDQMKGLDDLQASIDSEEARMLRQHMASLPPTEMRTFLEELMLFAVYMHGTHVAGIAVEGNPYAEILGARITFDHRQVPEPPTVEQALRAAENYQKTVGYFQAQGVRVVNMSWGWTFSEIEGMLEVNGIGKDAEERREKTRAIFKIYRDGLFNAIKNAQDILFVTAAGNADNDVEFDQVIPSSFDLPNLLVVGAVDQAGEETSFTSFGEQVTLHANGFEVDSFLPGGSRLKASGTSMASPNVVNLAGKLFAVKPELTPLQVIELIENGVEKSEDGRIFLINPKKSLGILIDEE